MLYVLIVKNLVINSDPVYLILNMSCINLLILKFKSQTVY